MKIALLMYSFIPHMGGAQIFAYNLINQLSLLNHEIHLYLPYKRYKQFIKIDGPNNFKVLPILRYEYFLARSWPALLRIRLKLAQKIEKYDIWQAIGSYPAGWIGKNLSDHVPVILRSHGSDIQKNTEMQYGIALDPIIEKIIYKTLSKVTHLVALTETVTKCYEEYSVPNKKITEIPNGVSLNRFNYRANPKIIRKKYVLTDDQIFILSVGRYHIKKGYEYIPSVCKYLKSNGINFKWIIVGKGVSVLQSIVDKEYLNDSIILVEEIDFANDSQLTLDVPSNSLIELYKSADLFVMPSLLETFGMVLIEAMAAGLPIVSTKSPGCRDVIIDGYNGVLAEPANSKDIADKINSIISSPDLRNSLINNAKKSVNKYEWKTIAEKYEKLYHDCLDKLGQPPNKYSNST